MVDCGAAGKAGLVAGGAAEPAGLFAAIFKARVFAAAAVLFACAIEADVFAWEAPVFDKGAGVFAAEAAGGAAATVALETDPSSLLDCQNAFTMS